jgi:hypothetical protein
MLKLAALPYKPMSDNSKKTVVSPVIAFSKNACNLAKKSANYSKLFANSKSCDWTLIQKWAVSTKS